MDYFVRNAHRLGIDIRGLKVLDFGCGDGRHVSALVDAGIDAYGADIDHQSLAQAEKTAPGRVSLIRHGRTSFEDGCFDYVMSNQVIEHVVNLEEVVAEVARILKPGGVYYSASPARWVPIEPHIFIPFVHWIPPGDFRRRYLQAFIFAGIGNPFKRTAVEQDEYLRDHTFYRSRSQIRRAFAKHFDVRFVAGRQLRAALRERGVPLSHVFEPVLEGIIGTVHEHRLLMTRR